MHLPFNIEIVSGEAIKWESLVASLASILVRSRSRKVLKRSN